MGAAVTSGAEIRTAALVGFNLIQKVPKTIVFPLAPIQLEDKLALGYSASFPQEGIHPIPHPSKSPPR
jgi:hypothetical protein